MTSTSPAQSSSEQASFPAQSPNEAPAPRQDTDRLPSLILDAADRHGDRVALRIRRNGVLREVSYREMAARIRGAAARLKGAGIREGDRVVLLGENDPQWPIAYFAISEAGATVVPLDPGLPPASLRRLFEASSPRLLVVSRSQRDRLDDTSHWNLVSLEELSFGDGAIARLPDAPPDPDADTSLASVIFTSGTSGRPTGVMLAHEGLVYAGRDCAVPLWGLTDRDEMLLVLPLHHVYGFAAALIGGLVAGASLTFVEAIRGDIILAAINETHTTILPAIPRLLELFHQQILRQVRAKGEPSLTAFRAMGGACATLRRTVGWNAGPWVFKAVFERFGGSLRRIVSAGAPLPLEVNLGLSRLGFSVLEGYGLTETSAASTGCTFDEARPGRVGMPLRGMDVRIHQPDATGQGEVCIRGKGLMRGYFRNPELTAQVIRDGWFHTGDLGRIDAQGYLSISGRLDELIVTPAGKKACPFDVESGYRDLPGVKELAVVGMRSPAGVGDEVHAAIVIDDAAADGLSTGAMRERIEAEISARASGIASHLRIQKTHFVSEIPKTTKLSVRYQELRQRLEQRSVGGVEPEAFEASQEPTDPLVVKVLEIVAEVAQAKRRNLPVRETSTLQFDLGIDSLGRTELAVMVDKELGVRLGPELMAIHRISDLVELIRSTRASETPAPKESSGVAAPPPRGPVAIAIARGIGVAIHTVWDVRAVGAASLPDGPYILCPNHTTYLDGIWAASVMPHERRAQMCSFGKHELWNHRVTKLLVTRLANAIPVDRDGNAEPALRAGIEVLRSGRPLLVHPEGTRSRSGELGAFRRGAASMSLATGAPLIPARLVGSREVYPPHRRIPKMLPDRLLRRRSVLVHFGAPIYPVPGETAVQLTERLRRAVLELGGE